MSTAELLAEASNTIYRHATRLRAVAHFVEQHSAEFAEQLRDIARRCDYQTVKVPDNFDIRGILFRPSNMPERDARGEVWHQDLDLFVTDFEGNLREGDDEGGVNHKLLAAAGFQIRNVEMEQDEVSPELWAAYDAGDGCSGWNPTAPDGDGWQLVAIFESEDDGMRAAFVRAKPASEHSNASDYPNPEADTTLRNEIPTELHPRTADLVQRFAAALAAKLLAAQIKYSYSDGWASDDWIGECRAKLLEHISKGDPLDVANYCAFLWHHGASTTAPGAPEADERAAEAVAPRRIRQPIQPLYLCPIDGRLRFQPNAIVQHLKEHGGIDMNALARLDFPPGDREQFAQLIGYSHDGFGTLSYATDRAYDKAIERYERRQARAQSSAAPVNAQPSADDAPRSAINDLRELCALSAAVCRAAHCAAEDSADDYKSPAD